MMGKFNVGKFGMPERVKGISQPMNASIGNLGRITLFSPALPGGNFNPTEYAVSQTPKMPRYRNMPRMPKFPGSFNV